MTERTVASERIYDGKVVSLRLDTVEFADGRRARREVVEHSGVVAIVALDNDDRLILVRQFRSPVGASLLEVVAGGIDAGEEPEAAAQRELQEEIGYRAATMRRLAGFWVAPGYSTEFIHVYVASELSESRLDADDDEQLTAERYSLDEALALVQRGDICDAKSIVGILTLANERAGGGM